MFRQGFIGLLTFCVLVSCSEKEPVKKTNIVLINIDDMGWRDVGFMGSEFYHTPNIDALAKMGMYFTNGYATAANCAPSRASLLTGLWPTRHQIYTVGSSERGNSKDRKLIPVKNTTILSKTHIVIPKILQENGYSTCHAGKWHLSEDPLEYGFDRNIGGGRAGHPQSYYPPYKNIQLKNEGKEYLTDLIMKNTLNFIDTVQNPFFLYYSPYAVHTPIQAIDSLIPKYNNKRPSNGQGNIPYATMIENLDRNIGDLVVSLKNRELLDNTLIIFTSDNGGLYGITKQPPLRAGKGSYYEGGIREPFVFVFGDRIRPNSKKDIPITNLDIFPTIMDFAGIQNEDLILDGTSLRPILEEKTMEIERPLFWHFPIYLEAYNVHDNQNRDSLFRTRPGSVVRYGNWKLHYYFEDGGIELYDVNSDLGETDNLVEDRPEKVAELLNLLEAWWQETDAPIPSTVNPDYRVLSEAKMVD